MSPTAVVPTAKNGKIDEAWLGVLPGQDGDGTQHTADILAVESYKRLTRDMKAAGMGVLIPSSGYSCYRTLNDQRHMRAIGATTIPVGKSIHGEALAVDFADLGGFGTPRHNWLVANAIRYGWYQPNWAKKNGSLPEFWHWEYDARSDTQPGVPVTPPPTTSGDDDLTPDESKTLTNAAIYAETAMKAADNATNAANRSAQYADKAGISAEAARVAAEQAAGAINTVADELRALRRDLGLPPV